MTKSSITIDKVSETLFTFTAAVNETALLKKEVSRLRHHVTQLAKKLHRKEEELREERGKGRGVIIKVVEKGTERVEFLGGEEVARAPVEEEEVAVARVRLPSVASSVAPSVADCEALSEVADEDVAEEVEVAQMVEASVVAQDGRAQVAMVVDEVDEEPLVEEGRRAMEGVERVGLSGLEGVARGLLKEESGMSVLGEGDVRVGLEDEILRSAPRGPRENWVPEERNKKRRISMRGPIQPGEWSVVGGVPVKGVAVPTGPRVMARPLVRGHGGALTFAGRGSSSFSPGGFRGGFGFRGRGFY